LTLSVYLRPHTCLSQQSPALRRIRHPEARILQCEIRNEERIERPRDRVERLKFIVDETKAEGRNDDERDAKCEAGVGADGSNESQFQAFKIGWVRFVACLSHFFLKHGANQLLNSNPKSMSLLGQRKTMVLERTE
jgi:hypothetical protein